jgi:hypothetical protein
MEIPASGFWSGLMWTCQICGKPGNSFGSRKCIHCDAPADSLIRSLQLVRAGDEELNPIMKNHFYSEAANFDPDNVVALMRLKGFLDYPDFMYPNYDTMVSEYFGSFVRQQRSSRENACAKELAKRYAFAMLNLDQSPASPVEKPSTWLCETCSFENSEHLSICEMCDSQRSAIAPSVPHVQPFAPSVVADPEFKNEAVDHHSDIPKIRKLCNSLGVAVEQGLLFEELYEKCRTYSPIIHQLSFIADEALRKLKNQRFDGALKVISEGSTMIEKFNSPELKRNKSSDDGGFVLIDGKSKASIHLKDMYKEVLAACLVNHSLSGDALSLLADTRNRYGLTDQDQAQALKELGVSEADFKRCQSKGNSGDISSKECVVCMEGVSSHIILDCMHLSVCENCVDLVKSDKNCPQCRKTFSSIRKVY